MHPYDLNIIFTLTSRIEPDWIASIALVNPTDKHGTFSLNFTQARTQKKYRRGNPPLFPGRREMLKISMIF